MFIFASKISILFSKHHISHRNLFPPGMFPLTKPILSKYLYIFYMIGIWKCNFPMILIDRSVCHSFLKRRKVTLSYGPIQALVYNKAFHRCIACYLSESSLLSFKLPPPTLYPWSTSLFIFLLSRNWVYVEIILNFRFRKLCGIEVNPKGYKITFSGRNILGNHWMIPQMHQLVHWLLEV